MPEIHLHNKFKYQYPCEPKRPHGIRTEECVENLASCLGVTPEILLKLGILKSEDLPIDSNEKK